MDFTLDMIPTGHIYSLEDASTNEIEKAFRKCHLISQQAAGNFYYAFVFLPARQRRGIEALYAFCRAGDDLADEDEYTSAYDDKSGLLDNLRKKLDLCFDEKYCDGITLALASAIQEFHFEREHFIDLLKGIEMDLTISRYETFNDLRTYCFRVASVVGLLCLKVFGCDNLRTRYYAEFVGIGMQMTNILRDLHEDYRRDRIYIPLEDLVRFNINERELFEENNQTSLKELIVFECNRAREFYRLAEDSLVDSDRKPMYVARIMAAIYLELLKKIIINERLDKRIELTVSEKMKIGRVLISRTLGA